MLMLKLLMMMMITVRQPFCFKISQVRRRLIAHWSEIYGGNDVASCALTPPCHQDCPFSLVIPCHQVSALFFSQLQQQVKGQG